jgi:hypothetical protein
LRLLCRSGWDEALRLVGLIEDGTVTNITPDLLDSYAKDKENERVYALIFDFIDTARKDGESPIAAGSDAATNQL